MTGGVHRDTIMRLGVRVGQGCAAIMDDKMHGLNINLVQVDELWGFIGAKQKTAKANDMVGAGDVWMWVAMDAETKLGPVFLTGKRDKMHAVQFMDDLASRLVSRPQISSDAFRPYVDAIERAFGTEVDYGTVIKTFIKPSPTPILKPLAAIHRAIKPLSDFVRNTKAHIERLKSTQEPQILTVNGEAPWWFRMRRPTKKWPPLPSRHDRMRSSRLPWNISARVEKGSRPRMYLRSSKPSISRLQAMKKYEIAFSPAAHDDLDEILRWLSEQTPEKVSEWYAAIKTRIQTLSRLPERCPHAPENGLWGNEKLRQLLFQDYPSKYRIIFTITKSSVHLLNIRHGARRYLHEAEEG